MKSNKQFIIVGQMGDGKPGYWNGRGELWADRAHAKVYKQQGAAERVADEMGMRVEQVEPRIRAGDRLAWRGGEIRIMAVAEGYVMARRPGAMPFVVSLKELS